MPRYATSLGATVAQVGIIIALQPYVAAILQAPVGLLSDRIGRRLLIVGMLIHMICFVLYPLTSSLSLLMSIRAFNGLANAAFYPATSALVVDLAPNEKRGQALGLFATSTQLGSMAGPAMGGVILKNYGFPATFLCSAAIAAMTMIFAMTRMGLVRSGAIASAGEHISWGWLWSRGAIASVLGTMFVMVGIGSVITFLPIYAVEIDIDVARVGLIISTLYVGSILTRALAGKTSDRVGRVPILLVGMLLCTTGIYLFSIFTEAVPLHLSAFIFGMGMGSALPACSALIADVAPVKVRGFAMGLNSASFNTGQAIGATGLGIVAASVGFAKMYLTTTVVIAFGLLAIFTMMRQK